MYITQILQTILPRHILFVLHLLNFKKEQKSSITVNEYDMFELELVLRRHLQSVTVVGLEYNVHFGVEVIYLKIS